MMGKSEFCRLSPPNTSLRPNPSQFPDSVFAFNLILVNGLWRRRATQNISSGKTKTDHRDKIRIIRQAELFNNLRQGTAIMNSLKNIGDRKQGFNIFVIGYLIIVNGILRGSVGIHHIPDSPSKPEAANGIRIGYLIILNGLYDGCARLHISVSR